MGDLYQFLQAFVSHWWPLVSAGSLLGIEEFAERYWGWLSEKLKKIPDGRRNKLKLTAMVIAAFYSGFLAWSDEHNARIAAEHAASERSRNLGRTLSYDNLGISMEHNDQGTIFLGLSGNINNLGQEAVMLKIKNLKMYIGGKEIFNAPLITESYIAPNHGIVLNSMSFRPPVVILDKTTEITQEWQIDYDTASPSGVRHSYRKVQFPLTWVDGKGSSGRGIIVETRED